MRKYSFLFAIIIFLGSCQKDIIFEDDSSVDTQTLKSTSTDQNLRSSEQYNSWPGVFDPANVISLYFRMTEADWNTVRFDATNDIYKYTWFRATGEQELKVKFRRKSSRALPSEEDPWKIGMKVKINVFDNPLWRDLKKLSLENGSDVGPVSEGVAWNLHELASQDGFYGEGVVHAGLAAWVKVFVKICEPDDGEGFLLQDTNPIIEDEFMYLGVYVNVEQRDKQFLRNRDVYLENYTYLYEVDDIYDYSIDIGLNGDEDGPHSETFNELDFIPFLKTGNFDGHDDVFKSYLDTRIDMQAMLTQGAIDAYSGNSDALFGHGKNFKFIDFQDGYSPVGFEGDTRRIYYPWDLDAVFGPLTTGIYGKKKGRKYSQSPYQERILNHPDYREQYNEIMLDLLMGPLSSINLTNKFLLWESVLDEALLKDPYEIYGTQLNFSEMIHWVSVREDNVKSMVEDNNTPEPR